MEEDLFVKNDFFLGLRQVKIIQILGKTFISLFMFKPIM